MNELQTTLKFKKFSEYVSKEQIYSTVLKYVDIIFENWETLNFNVKTGIKCKYLLSTQ